ncbi:MAG TPA: hypothetical protein VFQ32_07845 [Ktedonobacterales bacterium]|nr:hypothetical protein [Ktedonobacterales bacterium]
MRGTFGALDARQMERMRLALVEALCAHFTSPPFFDPRAGSDRVRPLDRDTLENVGHFVHSVNFSPLDATDVASHEVRRFLEGLLLRYLNVNPAFKHPRFARYLPALRARAPRLAADIHRSLLASLDGKASGFGAAPAKRSWAEGRERARKIPPEDYERSTRILEAAMIRSRIDDYSNSGFVPQAEPADVARRPAPAQPAPPPATQQQQPDQWLNSTTGDLTTPVSSARFAAAFSALGVNPTSAQPAAPRIASDQPTSPLPVMSTPPAPPARQAPPRNGSVAPRELPDDLYELYGDYLQDMQPDTTVTPAVPARPAPPPPAQSRPAPAPWQSSPSAPAPSSPSSPMAPPTSARGQTSNPNPATHADQMVFWQLRYQLEAYVRRAAESYGLSYNGSDPSAVLDALRQSGFVDEADLRIAEGILALTDRVTRAPTVAIEDYRQAFLLYLLYHRSHLGI